MKLGGNARFMTDVRTPEEVATIYKNARSKKLPIFIIGDGSNVIAKDAGFNGIIVHMRIPGFEIIADDINTSTIKIGAGENWDSVVKRTTNMGLSGIEAMSNIPGTAGATPVQNVGAYGQEIADTLQSLEAYDSQADTLVTLSNADCGFAYRNSIFRDREVGRYVITSITIKLSKNQPQPPFYDSLQEYLDKHGVKIYTNEVIRNNVIEIRKSKLPDPYKLPNSGSFFKNPIVGDWQIDELKTINPDIPLFDMGDKSYKVPAGWLIEQVGLKGNLINGIRVFDKNAMVLVNESATSYDDLANTRDEIIGKVRNKFHIQIQQEPLEI